MQRSWQYAVCCSLAGLAMLSGVISPLQALEEAVAITFGPDGCWHYVGTAYEYVGQFRAGTYLTMNTVGAISADTEQGESRWEWRDPMLLEGNFITQVSPGGIAYVPVSPSGRMTVTFAPRSSFGWRGRADLCVVAQPPR